MKHPLAISGYNYCSRAPKVMAACNLLAGMEVLDLDERSWIPINVDREDFTGKVWSLSVDKTRNYFGDGVLTHNCLWYAAQLATELGLNLEEIAENNLEKLSARKSAGELKHE